MATYRPFNDFQDQLLRAQHNALAAGDQWFLFLTNSTPSSTFAIKSEITEIAGGNGYTSGGTDIQNFTTRSGGVVTVGAVSFTYTATGGSIGPFVSAVVYNNTQTSDPLVCFFNHTTNVTLAEGDSFRIEFNGATAGTTGTLLTLSTAA